MRLACQASLVEIFDPLGIERPSRSKVLHSLEKVGGAHSVLNSNLALFKGGGGPFGNTQEHRDHPEHEEHTEHREHHDFSLSPRQCLLLQPCVSAKSTTQILSCLNFLYPVTLIADNRASHSSVEKT